MVVVRIPATWRAVDAMTGTAAVEAMLAGPTVTDGAALAAANAGPATDMPTRISGGSADRRATRRLQLAGRGHGRVIHAEVRSQSAGCGGGSGAGVR